ncbi:hypothetical protein DPMN_048364 [Dreissena polymorpha]|uniref:Uncharacterized protein n=1 Tax=Dreissena polymorpha TaxID=45954 RepID=A0A9D4I2A7_DREPO|nr:hypothetical protein DPMN_048364 [Dreissena polymorpha]
MNNRAILEGATSLTPPSIAFSTDKRILLSERLLVPRIVDHTVSAESIIDIWLHLCREREREMERKRATRDEREREREREIEREKRERVERER